ncbi:MAG: anthranilate synthase component I family protein [Verrucomicrobia bacterium]|nr:anthranilate synthase component I family protein [Pseudomonadota bacterium]NBS07013.1 anthranilate synthase component I family protein [Verrucomicrobiota bacterium]NBS79818.1 anthranilate synthase component I family protein [bacterium]NBV97317.1 anthranilate synthase component I family protein [Verrucomicrobiota bacterium]NBY66713.1 anthranilate synthase component I family protein [Verrucomicrobiota bacterium]
MRRQPEAAVVRGDYGAGVVYLGYQPDLVLSGGFAETGRLEAELTQRRKKSGGWDRAHPTGAAVGAFDFEGNWHFSFFSDLEVEPSSGLWPEGEGSFADTEEGWSCRTGMEEYAGMVRQAQEEIRRGEIYQVNLARFLHRDVEGLDPWEFFRWLWRTGQAPRSFFYRMGKKALAGASMELLLGMEGERVITQPIKGTRARVRAREGDERAALELGTDPKEVAELVMITDLLRNDLGAICQFGSVEVRDLVRSRSYSHVHHLYSTIEGVLRPGLGRVEAVRECLPGGSVTGAPKRRAVEILKKLEVEPRGFYTGAVGYFGYDGTARFAMGIRMAEMEGNHVRCGIGSGITIGSDPWAEYEETKAKARVMVEAMAAYEAARRVRA